jgi:hypothetical protein
MHCMVSVLKLPSIREDLNFKPQISNMISANLNLLSAPMTLPVLNSGSLVENIGFEPMTSSMPWKRSSQLS